MFERIYDEKIYFDDSYPVIVVNCTNTEFISSISGLHVYESKIAKEKNWYFPITPQIMIHMVGNKTFKTVYKNNQISMLYEEKDVKFINEKILETSILFKNDCVFSKSKNELERLKYLL